MIKRNKKNSSLKTIEIEFRAMLSKEEHGRLQKFFDKNAKDLGEDDKDVYFYIFPDKLLKLTDNTSQNNAKITLKLNRIGKGSEFEEIEFPINREDVAKAALLFDALHLTDHVMHNPQQRHNYLYKGVELALKWSSVWGYHLEMEILVRSKSGKKKAEDEIKKIAAELGVRLMTEEELREFEEKVQADNLSKK